MVHQLILQKGAEQQVHEFGDIEEALKAAEPWIRKGYTARIVDKQGVVKDTQVLVNGQITTNTGTAAPIAHRTGGRMSSWAYPFALGGVLILSEYFIYRNERQNKAEVLQRTEALAIRLLLLKGRVALAGKDFDLAITSFEEAIRKDPKCAAAYFFRGIAYSQKGDHVRALADREEAIRLNPAFAKESPR